MDKNRLSTIDALLQESIDKKQFAGINAMILKDGEEVYYGQAGVADIENNVPMARDTIFRLYSASKPITAVAAMILVERGVIELLEPVSKYLLGFENQSYYDENGCVCKLEAPLLLKDLLGMTSGLPYGDTTTVAGIAMQQLWDEVYAGQLRGEETDTVTFANRMGRLPLAFKPGAKWQYGTSADVMGAVIEVASGMRFGDFLKKEIFDPLGMHDTAFWLPEGKKGRFSAAYTYKPEGLERWDGAHLCILPRYHKDPAFQSGGAGLLSTIEDYARFAQMLCNGGSLNGARILSRRTVQYLTQNQLTEDQRKAMSWDNLRGYGYANFMRIAMHEGQAVTPASVGEYGWDGWLGCYFAVSPADNMVLLLNVQRLGAGTTDYTRKLRAIAYAALDEE